ncbi:MAG: serine hydrolase, partial [Lachnospiraceae bacterium]|nr:serine hydrolase [Lachnospiraceae bacterium]
MDIIGIERFNEWVHGQGQKNTLLMRKMMDFEAIKQGKNNYMTAGDAGVICSKIAKGEYQSKEISDTILTMMRSQQYRNKIPALIPAIPSYSGISGEIPEGSVLVGNKTGDLVGIQHDVGIFELPDHRRYVVSMFTDGLEKDCDGIQAIGKVSLAVYEALK